MAYAPDAGWQPATSALLGELVTGLGALVPSPDGAQVIQKVLAERLR